MRRQTLAKLTNPIPRQSHRKQAVDRFHRIGQKNAVQVIDFAATVNIDKERNDKIDWKWSVLKELLGGK